MNHTEAIETMAAEKYLLDEFAPEERDAFEEHFFSCDTCAQDVTAGAVLLKTGKEIFVQERAAAVAARPAYVQPKRKREWLAWLRPAFAVPAMALLLGVVVFQNLVQFPAMHEALEASNRPALLPPPLYLGTGSARGAEHVVTARPGQAFVVQIDIRGESSTAYTAELYDGAGQRKWSLPLPGPVSADSLSLQVPGGDYAPGNYTLVVRGAPVAGQPAPEISKYAFTLNRP